MTDGSRPAWVDKTLKKYVGKKAPNSGLPTLGRNMQAEVLRLQAVIDVVSKHRIPAGEITRLRNKAQDLLNILNSRQ